MRAGMRVCGIDKGMEASVNLMRRGRSTQELLDSHSGADPCQAEAGTEIGTRH